MGLTSSQHSSRRFRSSKDSSAAELWKVRRVSESLTSSRQIPFENFRRGLYSSRAYHLPPGVEARLKGDDPRLRKGYFYGFEDFFGKTKVECDLYVARYVSLVSRITVRLTMMTNSFVLRSNLR